jgi:2-polyprenyl-3-methyl-5-hydroxy-6-metoxy-1,4-benzoquinol methylase
MNPDSPQHVKGTPAATEVWERQYRSGGWDYLAGDDEAGHYLAIAEICRRYLRDGSLLDIGCGTGLLLAHLQRHAGIAPSCYTGIDISQEALLQAASSWPGANLSRLDYRTEEMPGRYDGVIFNETLYYFDDPAEILDKSIAENMEIGALLIVSMYGDHHGPIWDALEARCNTVDELMVENSNRVHWKIRALRPRAESAAGSSIFGSS